MVKPVFDVLILGGGVVGMSTACHLAMRGATNSLRVAVVERDASYRQASAVLSAGGLRQQFSLAENIKMSLYGLEFIRAMPDVQFREQGYVFTAGSRHCAPRTGPASGRVPLDEHQRHYASLARTHRGRLV